MYWQGWAKNWHQIGYYKLKQSDNFVYLGGVISADSSCDKEVARRIGIASGVVRNLVIYLEVKGDHNRH